MASTITAGNATNGLGISSDNTGILQIKTGAGAGTAAFTLDATQNATFAGTVAATAVVSPTGALYPLVLGTAVNVSGTSVDFTSIPATARRITVMFNGVSTNGTNEILVQIGTSTGIVSAGYASGAFRNGGGQNSSAGFIVDVAHAASYLYSGSAVLTNFGANTWVCSGTLAHTNDANGATFGGNVSLTGALDRVRVTTPLGVDIFDAGSINIMWE